MQRSFIQQVTHFSQSIENRHNQFHMCGNVLVVDSK